MYEMSAINCSLGMKNKGRGECPGLD